MAEFRIKRCLGLIRMQTMEHWQIYIISLGMVAVITFCLGILSEDGSLIAGFYPVLLCISGCLAASSVYNTWTRFGRSSFYLMLPSSACEKFTAAVLYSTLIFIPVFTIVYFFTGYFFLNLYYPMSFFEMISGGKNIVMDYWLFYTDTFLIYFLLLPFFLFSAARFRRFQFPATLLILVVLFIVYNYWQLFLLYEFSGGLAFGHTFFIKYGDFDFYNFLGGRFITQTIDLVFSVRIWNVAAWLVIGVGLYMAAFHRLKEREI